MVFELSPTSLMLYSWFAPPSVAETGNCSKVTVQLLAWVSSFTVPVAAPSLYNSTLTLSTGAALSFPKKFFHSFVTLTSRVGGIIGVHGVFSWLVSVKPSCMLPS